MQVQTQNAEFDDAPSMAEFGVTPDDYRELASLEAKIKDLQFRYLRPSRGSNSPVSDWLALPVWGACVWTAHNVWPRGDTSLYATIAFICAASFLLWAADALVTPASEAKMKRRAELNAEIYAKEAPRYIERRDKLATAIESYETSNSGYFCSLAEREVNQYLYRKQPTAPGFADSIMRFNKIYEAYEAGAARYRTKQPSLRDLKKYVDGRRSDLERMGFATAGEDRSKPLRAGPVGVKNAGDRESSHPPARIQESKPPQPPEKIFRSPRQIDWAVIQKARMETGEAGEEIVAELEKDYLTRAGRTDLAERVAIISKSAGDGAGYDILSFTADGEEKYVEVKATTGEADTPFYLSRNELNFLRENHERAFIYRVSVDAASRTGTVRVLSAEDVLAADLTPVSYQVKINP